jgi:hypothetical protein
MVALVDPDSSGFMRLVQKKFPRQCSPEVFLRPGSSSPQHVKFFRSTTRVGAAYDMCAWQSNFF